MSQINWEADKMLDVYIYDYLLKRNLLTSAKTFQAEGKVSSDPVAIDAPGGFLLEWWSVFWDVFIARTNENHSDVAASYTQTQLMKAREQQRMQMQHLLLQRQQQQQQQQWREGGRLLNGTANGLAVNDSLVRQNPATANVLATKTYEEQLKLLLQSNPLDDTSMKQRCGDNVGPLLDPNHASMLKTAATEGQPSGKVLHGTAGGMSGALQQAQAWNQQLTGVAQDVKSDVNPVLSSKAAGPDGLLIGLPGSNQGGSNLTLKGWPLTITQTHQHGPYLLSKGLDQLWSRLLQQQNSFMQSSQPISQLQLLTPQQQQQLLLHAQSSYSSVGDIDVIRPRTLVNNRNIVLGKDGQSNLDGDVISNVGSPVQAACPVLPSGDAKMLRKVPSSLQNFSHFSGVEAEMELTNSRLSQ